MVEDESLELMQSSVKGGEGASMVAKPSEKGKPSLKSKLYGVPL